MKLDTTVEYKPVLYVIATPIGNTEDITVRGLRMMRQAKIILAEDTRVSKKLFDLLEVDRASKKFITLQHHTKSTEFETVAQEIRNGEIAALITDAGTPNISDPGGMFIRFLVEHAPDIHIVPIPGASALTTLLSVSGVNVQEFVFRGFVPHKKGRRTMMSEIATSPYPVVVFESCHRIEKFIDEYEVIVDELGSKNIYIVVGRELTKKFETIYRGVIADAGKKIKNDPKKGEYVILISTI